MKITVDDERCQGHARCWAISPQVFDLDDEGHSIVILADVPPELEKPAREAMRNCPERAIAIN
jgi:ferredoxin